MLAVIRGQYRIARCGVEWHRSLYKLDIQPTLFGEWSSVREWGRIGRAGAVHIETHGSRGMADIAMAMNWARKLKRGYR